MAACSVVGRAIPGLLLLLAAACQTAPDAPGEAGPDSGFRFQQVFKGDIDMVAETHLELSLGYLRELTEKLYRRNPVQWRRGGNADAAAALARVFGADRPQALAALDGQRSIAAVRLAFEPDYPGDRILAFSEGLRTMLLDAYGGKRHFYLTDHFDAQKLHDAARNLEIAFWKLGHTHDAAGAPLILSNEADAEVTNLSFERLSGKLIALQDAMALVIADTTNRRIKNVIQSVGSAVFIPI